MLEVGAIASIHGNSCPAILQNPNFWAAGVDHGLNRKHHASFQPGTLPLGAKVRDLGIFVHATANSVTNKVADDTKSLRLTQLLHRRRDIAQSPTHLALLDSLLERCLGNVEQLVSLRRYRTNWIR